LAALLETAKTAFNIPNILVGDYYRLQRILINLISNAIKFTAAGHVELQVALLSQTKKFILLRFIVADTGVGIATEHQEYIFEKFSRLNLSNKGTYKRHSSHQRANPIWQI
jgi:signal transduction histidine kinase